MGRGTKQKTERSATFSRWRQPNERLLLAGLRSCAWLVALAVVLIFLFLLYFSLPALRPESLKTLLNWHWRPYGGEFGILPMVVGSLLLAVSALALAYPLGIALCLFIHGLGPRILRRPLRLILHLMTGVPTVVYGFIAAFLLVPMLRQAFHGSGFSWLAASLTLSLLILPTIVLMLNSQFEPLRARLETSFVALGYSPEQALLQGILPLARQGLLAAAVLGFGRAIGDTLISLMLAGNAPLVPEAPLDSLRTLTAHIALVLATDAQSSTYQSLFVCGTILFGVSLLVNLSLRRLTRSILAPESPT